MKHLKTTLVLFFVLAVAAAVSTLGRVANWSPVAEAQTHAQDEQEGEEGSMCGEHDVPESECGICHPDFAAALSPGQGLKIRFAAAESASRAGIETAAPSVESVTGGVECYAEITFDQNRIAYVVSPVEGVLDDVEVDLGDHVRAGTTLARISSAVIAEARSEHLRALAESRLCGQAFERERTLFASRVASERDVQEAAAARDAAEAAVQQARGRLRVLGFDDERIAGLESSAGGTSATLEMRAPFAGEVIERDAVRGSRVEPGKRLFAIADRSVMWGVLNIPERELSDVRVGQRVELTADAREGDVLEGTITWVSPEVDARTRMSRARMEIRDGAKLRSGTFARAWIETVGRDRALVVPLGAVQQVANKPFVFVKLGEDLYEARAVALGASRNGRVEVTEGLRSDDQVAVTHSYIVKSELLKSRLGAGCVDE